MSGLAPNDLTKLTVPQLKALCKDRHITGYSKLTKSALLHKLSTSQEVSGLAPVHSIDEGNGPQLHVASEAPNSRDPGGILPVTEQTQVLPPTPPAPVPSLKNKPRAPKKTKRITESDGSSRTASRTELNCSSSSGKALGASPSLAIPNSGQVADISSLKNLTSAVSLTNETAKPTAHPPLVVPSQVLEENPPTSPQISSARAPNQPASNIFKVPAIPNRIISAQRVGHLATNRKRPGSPCSMMTPSKKAKNAVVSATQKSQRMDQVTSSRRYLIPVPLVTRQPAGPENEPPSMLASPNRNDLGVRASVPPLKTSAVASKGTKFKPLVVNKPLSFSGLPKAPNRGKTVFDPAQSVPNLGENTSLCYLDFPVSVPVSLSPITRPPSLSQRKRIPRWSIILSGVMEEDIIACLQVSRMFRYAIYLSAVYRLQGSFRGRRLAYMKLEYPQNITNMWPYLRQRKQEMSARREAYDKSFLPRYFNDRNPISDRLWTSPDHEKQITIAIRFVLTRLWFFLSIGEDHSDPKSWKVLDTQQLVDGEIWSVSCLSSTSPLAVPETFYVLESTCEVIGRPPPSLEKPNSLRDHHPSIPVRADWSEYIAIRLLPPSSLDSPSPPLLESLKWTNHEEYDKGISRHWLKTIGGEGELGSVKKMVAERYLLACVVGNSVSGRWMSSTQMAQEFAGLPSQLPSIKPKSPQVNLFFPSHHHVESVHFTTRKGTSLHPALAVVQTPGREYYILRDNGMIVGCEEDGTGAVWMHLLNCDTLGSQSA